MIEVYIIRFMCLVALSLLFASEYLGYRRKKDKLKLATLVLNGLALIIVFIISVLF